MPQSLSNVIVHLVFSTKNRTSLIDDTIKPRLHAYLATIGRDHDCEVYRVGGIADHVHLAIRLSRTVTLAALVASLKTNSTKWIKRQGPQYSDFRWQQGYGCFSVSASHFDKLVAYLDQQEEHHRKTTFQEEFRFLCQRYRVEIDERYCWD